MLQLVIREVSKTYPNGVQALKDVTLMARRRFTRPTAGAAAAAVALILTVGGFIFYNTNVLNAYRSASDTIHRQLRFEVHLQPHGFGNSGADATVVANGTYIKNLTVLPLIGYQPGRELRNAGDRRTHGLAPRREFPSVGDATAHGVIWADSERTAFEAVVGTDEDQIAVAPGTLRRSWTESRRRYFHYVADAPINNEYALYSAAYAVREAQWNDVAIRIFHHPGHAENLERMVRSIRASLDYNTRHLGPYPFRSFKVVEHPGDGRGMHADAGTIDYQEGFSLINPGDGPQAFDLPFWVVAHEVAHQWWGMQLSPTHVEGIGVVAETLANYSALRVVAETYGNEQMRRVLGMWRDQYEVPRTRAAVPGNSGDRLLNSTIPRVQSDE